MRYWDLYNKNSLLNDFSQLNFKIRTENVQSTWNNLENILMPIIDKLAPLTQFSSNTTVKSIKPTSTIKRKLTLRMRLLKFQKSNSSNDSRNCIKSLNIEIKHHFYSQKSNPIR